MSTITQLAITWLQVKIVKKRENTRHRKKMYLCSILHLIYIMLLYLFLQVSGVMKMLSSQFQKIMKQHSILLSFNFNSDLDQKVK